MKIKTNILWMAANMG